MIISVIGLGLIGGSLAGALKTGQPYYRIHGYDILPENRQTALDLDLVHRVVGPEDTVSGAEIIVLAVPPAATAKLLPEILDSITPEQLVIDLASAKEEIASAVKMHPSRGNYLAAHPMAGTEKQGPAYAQPGLFTGRKVVLCDSELTHPHLLEKGTVLFRQINMQVVYRSSATHDREVALVSHLPQVLSYLLAVQSEGQDSALDLAGSGFGSMTRLSASPASIWLDILQQNKKNIGNLLEAYKELLTEWQQALASGDTVELTRLVEKANSLKRNP